MSCCRFLLPLSVLVLVLVAGCSTMPSDRGDHVLEREAIAGTALPAPLPGQGRLVPPPGSRGQAVSKPNVHAGTGVFVRRMPVTDGNTGGFASGHGDKGVIFNFEKQPVQAVVKAVLGDYLKRTYAIKPGVKGNITFSTAHPVSPDEALPILETLLSWTGNALIEKGGHYLILPVKDAVAGNLAPGLGARAPGAGLSARLFPLQYISATEMKNLLKPFAPDDAFLLVDPMRNLLVMAGTPEQLVNYQRTIKTFDVDWLKGMSVGVFTLKHANVAQLMPQLNRLFGPNGSTPLAGMLRFIPIQRTNAIVVITPQADYLTEVHQWINRIDAGGGNRPQLYVYNVKNMSANALAGYLGKIYGGSSQAVTGSGGAVAPGLTSSTLGSSGGMSAAVRASSYGSASSGLARSRGEPGRRGDSNGVGSSFGNQADNGTTGLSGGWPAVATNTLASGPAGGATINGPQGVRITAVTANNQLLVRCRPSQWVEIESAIRQLDVVPLQVQIETRILEVQLTGEFKLGVQWYLEGLVGGHNDSQRGFIPGDPDNQQQWAIGSGDMQFHPLGDTFFYSFINSNLQAAVHAIETNGNTKVLSEPSLVVMNNQQAKIQVGEQIPVNQTYIGTGLGSGSLREGGVSTLGNVTYKDTGVILRVRPRINPGGLVYLDLNQIVSKPGVKDAYGNFPIQKRELDTKIAVQSGQTVLLGGLIQQNEGSSDTGIPWLGRIPILGRLFGSTSRQHNRTELLILITPRIINSSADARAITLDYQRKFESLEPLRAGKNKGKAVKNHKPLRVEPRQGHPERPSA